MPLEHSELEELEALVDQHSISTILDALATIAYGKAEHLLVNWQDKASARVWSDAGTALHKVSHKLSGV